VRGIVESVMARLEAEGLAVYWLAVKDKPQWPYVLLWGSGGQPASVTVGGVQDHLDDRLGVTCVSQSTLGVLDVVRRTRAALSGFQPTSPAWHVQPLVLWESQTAQLDRDVTLPDINQHPVYAVDLYRLVGDPMEV